MEEKKLNQEELNKLIFEICTYDLIQISLEESKELEERVIAANDPVASTIFMRVSPYGNLEVHSRIVVDSQRPWENYDFARNNKGADMQAHSLVVLNSGDPELNFYVARDLPVDMEPHLQVVYDSKDVLWNYKAAKYCSDRKHLDPSMLERHMERHAGIVFDAQDAEYCHKLLTSFAYGTIRHEALKSVFMKRFSEDEINYMFGINKPYARVRKIND